ncbi:hypothetical protein AMTRI_Chr03g56370 [Amborella trichopoda]|uniref:myosin-binding protein 7 n=1 Tax=Amborella trichopoda TaxID=13333 RepID=UPI0005D34A77|nr:myosin-binding protein 7 [Amborella trichopoda]|eukprot:XP_020532244.1 myosin-binding protein 7 [Amborella trichopoda]
MDSNSPFRDSTKSCSCSSSPNSSNTHWCRSVKRKLEETEDGSRVANYASSNFSPENSSVARIEIENELIALRETVSSQQQTIQELYEELEQERNACSVAAAETMSMILRLQGEKAKVRLEFDQYKRFAEERIAHDQQELQALEDLLYKKDQVVQSLNCEIQAYKHRMLSYGFEPSEIEAAKVDGSCFPGQRDEFSPSRPYGRNRSMAEKWETYETYAPEESNRFGCLSGIPSFYDYPPLRCNPNETQGPQDLDYNDVNFDLDKYASDETPRTKIYQLERIPNTYYVDGESASTRNVHEKVVIGNSPRRLGHLRRVSTDSSSSFNGLIKESGPDYMPENAGILRQNGGFRREDLLNSEEGHSSFRKVGNSSDFVDDSSPRIYTIDSGTQRSAEGNGKGFPTLETDQIGIPDDGDPEPKSSLGICDDYAATPRGHLTRMDTGETDIKKLYTRLQALEADRESMRQALMSMRTDKAQLILLREIAQQLCKEITPENMVCAKKPSLMGSFSFMSVLKWIVSFVFCRKKAHRSKYMFGLSPHNVGLLLLLEKSPQTRYWRCITGGR